MGLLQKLIHVLHRLDPDNGRWKAQNRKPLELSLAAAHLSPNPADRETRIEEAEAALAKLEHDFSDANKPDYARKLYLIDKCLFGVDIQPIAVQIAKLRFFISLVVSQNIDRLKDNANVTALPNLETKLVAANSLIPIERPNQGDLFRNAKIAEKEAELRGMNARYFSARTARTKRRTARGYRPPARRAGGAFEIGQRLARGRRAQNGGLGPVRSERSGSVFRPRMDVRSFLEFRSRDRQPALCRQEAIKDQKPLLEKHYGQERKQGQPDRGL